MVSVEARELGKRMNELLRSIRKHGEIINIIEQGETIARIVPERRLPVDPETVAAMWADIDRLTAEMAEDWPDGVSAVDAVREGRREL